MTIARFPVSQDVFRRGKMLVGKSKVDLEVKSLALHVQGASDAVFPSACSGKIPRLARSGPKKVWILMQEDAGNKHRCKFG